MNYQIKRKGFFNKTNARSQRQIQQCMAGISFNISDENTRLFAHDWKPNIITESVSKLYIILLLIRGSLDIFSS